MKSLIQNIEEALSKALQKALPEAGERAEVTPATQPQFGHYQCNSAMKLAKKLQRKPREIAELVVDALDVPLFSKVEIAGPGFINLTLSEAFLSEEVTALLADPYLLVPRPLKEEKVVVDFSSPNVAKEMHVGHLRSTIIGDCLARLFTFLGHDVLRLNHFGDWGTAFGMLIAYIQEEGLEPSTLPDLMHWYRASKKRFDEEKRFTAKARAAVVALQRGGAEEMRLWREICRISFEAFDKVYERLDVKIEGRGESFYNSMLPDVVEDLERKGLIQISDGAKCFFVDGYELPLMVQKSDGGYNYDTTDLAAMWHRVKAERADRIIIVTDAGQSQHFALIFLACQKAGYLDLKKTRFDHVPFGVVLGEDGKKFRTRSSEVEKLVDLLDEAIARAKALLRERGKEESDELAEILGIDAIKYADLSCNRISDYVFSYDRMLRFEGNTAAFILYAYVRIAGIKRKVNKDVQEGAITLQHPSEIDLGLHLLRFAEVLHAIQEDLMPHYLTDYLYQLAGKFNAFFRDCRVEGSQQEKSRLLLCEATAKVMKEGLTILGLKTALEM